MADTGNSSQTDQKIQYIPIRTGTIRPDQPVNFEVFIFIADRYVHYIKRKDPIDKDRLTKMKSKGVLKLYIQENEEQGYLDYLDEGLTKITDGKSLTSEQQVDIANSVMISSAEKAATQAIQSETGFKRTEDRVQKVIGFLMSEKAAVRKMLAGSGVSQTIFHHCANVATLSLSLASHLKITDPKEQCSLGIAALLHDIGKDGLNLPTDIAPDKYDVDTLKRYHEHPKRGAEKVSDKPWISPAIVELILNHEELGEGQGFPNKKIISRMPLPQQILNLCNEYDRMCTVLKIPPTEAMKRFYMDKLGYFSLDLIKALGEVINAK